MNDLHRINSVKRPRAKPLWVAVCLATAILIVLVSIAWATSVSNITGPTWNNTTNQWTLTGNVTYTGGEKTMCISGSFNRTGVGTVTYGPIACGLSSTNPFTCTISGSSVATASGSVSYVLNAWTGQDACSGSQSANLATGSFASGGTGPNAITLNRFAAARGAAGWQMAAVAMLGLLGLGAGLWWARNRRQALAG